MTLRKVVLLILGSFVVSLTFYYLFNRFVLNRGVGSAALAINSPDNSLTASLDGEILGKTPFYSDTLKAGDANLVLSSSDSSFKSKIHLTDGALTVVNYSLGPSEDFSEGETIWLEKSRDAGSLVIISDPDEVTIRLDDQPLGQTPLSSRGLASGDHTLTLSKDGYKSRTVKIQIQSGYRLNVKTRLLLLPLNVGAGLINYPDDLRFKIWDFSSSNASLYADTSAWAKGFVFYTKNLTKEASPSNSYNADFFLDFQGLTFNKDGAKTSSFNLSPSATEVKVAYLGRKADGGLSDDAKQSLTNLSQKALPKVDRVQVLPTGLGYLNVRSGPSLADPIIAKVNEGDKLTLLSEEGSYFKIQLPDGKTGYISQRYARKI